MQLQKIKKACMAYLTCTIIHAESGDWISNGLAMYSADGVPMTPDTLAALWGLTSKERDALSIREGAAEDMGYEEDAISNVSDGDDVELVYRDAIESGGKVVRIYESLAGMLYIPAEILAPVEKKDGVSLGLRRIKRFGKDDMLVVSMEGYLATGYFVACDGKSNIGKEVRKRVEALEALTRGGEESAI